MATCLNCIGMVILNTKLSNSSLEGASKTQIHTEVEVCLQYLESALAIFEDLESGEDIGSTSITAHTATVMSNIGRIYFMFGEFEKSLYYSQDCLGRRLHSLPSNDLDLAISSFNVNQTTKSLGKNQKR